MNLTSNPKYLTLKVNLTIIESNIFSLDSNSFKVNHFLKYVL